MELMMDDNTVPAERAEILMLRARVTALETAVMALLAAPATEDAASSLKESFEAAMLSSDGGFANVSDEVTEDDREDEAAAEARRAEREYIADEISKRTRHLDTLRWRGPDADEETPLI